MVFPPSRLPGLERAVRRSTAGADIGDDGGLHGLLSGGAPSSAALDTLVSALNVGETHFFREARQMQSLQERILPELIARRRSERRLRIWSAGCSTGEEVYTLAILVDRLLPARASWDVLILGTDINGGALQHARRGVYGRWSLRGNDEVVLPYLSRQGDRFEVVPRIRAMVTFGQVNLVEDGYPSPRTNTHAMDLVLCRNVLMYFDPGAARSVVRRLSAALVEGGWLVVSQVEAGLGVFGGLRRDDAGTAVYRKVRPSAPELASGHGQPTGATPGAERARTGHQPPRARPSQGMVAPGAAREAAPPGWPAVYEAALRLCSGGQRQDALRLLEEAVERDPMAAPLHYLCGVILLETERTEEALAALRRCTCAEPGFVPGHLAQAGLFVRIGSVDRARIALENTARLIAGLQPDDLVLEQDGLSVSDVHDLVTTQRELLGLGALPDVRHG